MGLSGLKCHQQLLPESSSPQPTVAPAFWLLRPQALQSPSTPVHAHSRCWLCSQNGPQVRRLLTISTRVSGLFLT